MLQSLHIKNYALLSEVEVAFGPGLNILTGETGAGKSIIIGALGTILGERVDTSVLRKGVSRAVVEGVFVLAGQDELQAYLREQELDADGEQLILRREIHENGRSRAFVNDTPVQLSVLQAISDLLVDLHGQHEHQSLLRPANHLLYLDRFGDLEEEVNEVSQAYNRLQGLLAQLNELRGKQQQADEKRELYAFQIAEIEKVDPSAEEEEELLREEKIVQNSEKLFSRTKEFFEILYEGEASAYDILSRVEHGLTELEGIDEQFGRWREDANQARLLVEELAKFLERYRSRLDFSPERLEEIQTRMAQLTGLKKRFGRSIPEVLALKERLQAELTRMENLGQEIAALEQEVERARTEFSERCQKLSARRRQAAQQLQSLLPEILHYLGMSGTRFKVALKYQDDPETGLVELEGRRYRATAHGMDFAEFLISANKGEDLRPLAKIASGGEISRVMLALKSLLAERGQIPILIFDEIDSGVSGRVAQAVGRKLKELAQYHQIICITHLPQIASVGKHHYSVHKIERDGRTETVIRRLTHEERTEEIARLLAGENISETHLNSARELLQEAAAE